MAKILCPECHKPANVNLIPNLGTDELPAFVPESKIDPSKFRHDCGALLEVNITNDDGYRGLMVCSLIE